MLKLAMDLEIAKYLLLDVKVIPTVEILKRQISNGSVENVEIIKMLLDTNKVDPSVDDNSMIESIARYSTDDTKMQLLSLVLNYLIEHATKIETPLTNQQIEHYQEILGG